MKLLLEKDLFKVVTMPRVFIGVLVFCLCGLSVWADDEVGKPIVGKDDLQFFADAAGFRGPEQGVTRLEVFALVNARQFVWVPQGGQFVAQYDLTVRAVSEDRKTVKSESWTRNSTYSAYGICGDEFYEQQCA